MLESTMGMAFQTDCIPSSVYSGRKTTHRIEIDNHIRFVCQRGRIVVKRKRKKLTTHNYHDRVRYPKNRIAEVSELGQREIVCVVNFFLFLFTTIRPL